MRIGTVTGSVWATKKSDGLRGQTLLLVRLDGRTVAAADLVGAGVGERVLLSFGAAARVGMPEAPVDAAIVGIVDEMVNADRSPAHAGSGSVYGMEEDNVDQ